MILASSFVEWAGENWLALTGLSVALLGLIVSGLSMRIARSVKGLANAALIESEVIREAVTHDQYGRPIVKVNVENTGPGIAIEVEVEVTETFEGPPDSEHPGWWIGPSRTFVADRLGVDKTKTVSLPASGDSTDAITVRWKDGAGKQSKHPDPIPPGARTRWIDSG